MNERGYSWPEAILTLTVVIVIFGTLLPFGARMSANFHEKKRGMYAMEAAYKGAILYQAIGQTTGILRIDDVSYEWEVSEGTVCVSYPVIDGTETRCAG